jgi:hypothetical protein
MASIGVLLSASNDLGDGVVFDLCINCLLLTGLFSDGTFLSCFAGRCAEDTQPTV